MIEESPPAMTDILRALSDRPEEWLTMEELAQAIRGKPDANWNTVAGTLGAFSRRLKTRYALESWPFENRHDHEVGGRVCKMDKQMATQIKKYLANK